MPDFDAITVALAARYAAAAVTPPTGFDNIKISTGNLAEAMYPLPCVLVFPVTGVFAYMPSKRDSFHEFTVRFYLNQTSDLERDTVSLRKWLTVLVDQLEGAAQLAGIVTSAQVQDWTMGLLSYGGITYSGIELTVRVNVNEDLGGSGMTEMTVDYREFEEAAKVLQKRNMERTAGRIVTTAMRKSANLVRKNVRAELRPHRKSGKLASNVRTRFKGQGVGFEARIRSEGPVAHLVAGGVQPHQIPTTPAATRVMTLRTGTGKKSEIIGFATVVQHPGFRGDPYFHRAVQKSRPGIKAELDAAIDRMAKALAARLR